MDQGQEKEEFQYMPGSAMQPASQPAVQAPAATEENTEPLLQWKASEFIDHQKGFTWFLPVVLCGLIIVAATYFLTKGLLTPLVIVVGTIAFTVFAKQKPRTLTYALFPGTIKIGTRLYSYDDFKSFSIVQDGALYSIFLEPIKRFFPPQTIYFPPEEGEKIFDFLAERLPHIERKADPVDRLMQKIRF